jgi:hypothetical protein
MGSLCFVRKTERALLRLDLRRLHQQPHFAISPCRRCARGRDARCRWAASLRSVTMPIAGSPVAA